jgi:hypothetical protein
MLPEIAASIPTRRSSRTPSKCANRSTPNFLDGTSIMGSGWSPASVWRRVCPCSIRLCHRRCPDHRIRCGTRQWLRRTKHGLLPSSRCDSAATVRSGEQEQTVANSGEGQQQCLQRFNQSLQRNQAWSGRRESNSRSQLGKLSANRNVGVQKL